ncbi:MAG: hypothetical protein ACOX2S_09345 [bacterium]
MVGTNGTLALVEKCYAIGAVTGNDDVGGLVGQNNGDVFGS